MSQAHFKGESVFSPMRTSLSWHSSPSISRHVIRPLRALRISSISSTEKESLLGRKSPAVKKPYSYTCAPEVSPQTRNIRRNLPQLIWNHEYNIESGLSFVPTVDRRMMLGKISTIELASPSIGKTLLCEDLLTIILNIDQHIICRRTS